MLNNNADLVGFIDGAWKINNNPEIQAGTRGYVKDSEGNLVLIFSGPVIANSPLQCELEALLFVINKLASNEWNNIHSIHYTDSLQLIKEIHKFKISIHHHLDKEIKDLILNTKIVFKKVDKILNCEADNLAK